MILVITSHPIQYQVPLWKKLTEAGIDLEVVFLTKQGLDHSYDPGFAQTFKWDIDLLDGYKHSFAKVNASPDVSSFFKVRLNESLKSIIDDRKVDAIWIQGWQIYAYWQIVLQAKLMGIPVWLRGESNDLRTTNNLNKIIKYIPIKALFKCVSKFLYIGEANKRFYLNWGVKPEQLIFAPYCIDVDRFQNKTKILQNKKIEFRNKWNIDTDAFVFIFSGKFIEKKRPDIILEAAQLLRKQNIHILYVGDGNLRKNLIDKSLTAYSPENFEDVNFYKSTIKVSFTGFLNQESISEAYIAADCLILPSDYGETWGLVVNEAYAHSIPAIVSDRCGSHLDLVLPIEPNLVFKYNNIVSLKDSMELAIKNKKKYEKEINAINISYSYSTIVSNLSELTP